MDYTKIDLNANATKGFADISAYMEELGNLSNNMKAQQKLKLLNHRVILKGLLELQGLNETLDEKVNTLFFNVEKALAKKTTPFLKIFSLHIFVFMSLMVGTVILDPDMYSIGYVISSTAMGCATGVLNLMLLRERKKYDINNLFFLLEAQKIEELEPLHKKLAKIIDDFKNEESIDNEKLKELLKSAIKETIN